MRYSKTSYLPYFSSVTICYTVTLLLLFASISPFLPYARAQTRQSFATMLTTSNPKKTLHKAVISGDPIFITIPKLELKKQIIPGIYNEQTKTWNISPSGVHFAQYSSRINDSSGNTLLYAHNNKWAFGLLYLLKPGDKVFVKTDTGYTFSYIFTAADDFDPSDTALFTYSGPPVLTLQTCSGIFNEYRRLYSFHLQGVEKS